MAKYKIGDRVRIVSERPASRRFVDSMVPYLGKEMTVSSVEEETLGAVYRFEEAKVPEHVLPLVTMLFPRGGGAWAFFEDWIAGPADKSPKEPLSVHIRFCGNVTVAELIKDGKVVKVENARRNPKDTYSRAEGARIAVKRLFAKKETTK